MREIIKETPVAVIHDPLNPQTPYIIIDSKGIMHAQFVTQEEADAFAETVNAPEEPEAEPTLPPEDGGDTADEHDQEDREQQKEDDMPRGVKKKVKAAVKKRAPAAKKRAVTAVKKAAKKFVKKVKAGVKAKKKKRAKQYDYSY